MTTTEPNVTTETDAQEPENGTQTADETTTATPDAPDASDAAQGAQDAAQGNAETFPREYVEKLRKEAAEARLKAKKADEYARELFAARVAATGRLADPTDLPFDAGHLDSPDALNAAIDALLDAKPHLASRVPRGNVGQGAGTASHDDVDLAALLRRGA